MRNTPSELHHITGPREQALFRRGIDLFNRREFFECHEVLEEVWTPARGPERQFLQALIHFAVGFYHHQRSNQAGAERQLRKGLKKIEPYLPRFEGVNTRRLHDAVSKRLEAIEAGRPIRTYPKMT
jgi:predicted metal-dependent hydrolase